MGVESRKMGKNQRIQTALAPRDGFSAYPTVFLETWSVDIDVSRDIVNCGLGIRLCKK